LNLSHPKKLFKKLNKWYLGVLTWRSNFAHSLMRKIVSILCLSLMLLQAIPVLHFFFEKKAVFYAYVDEEKPEQKSKVGKDDCQHYIVLTTQPFPEEKARHAFSPFVQKRHSSPLLEFLTPPPDAC
jgi:hypothetical protein